MKKLINYIFPICLVAIGVIFAVLGIFEFGFWDSSKGPMSGFYPTLVAILLIAMGIVCVVSAGDEKEPEFPKQNLLVILAVLAIFICSFLIGMFPSIFIGLIVWLMKIEGYSLKFSAIFALITVLLFYGTFGLWLGISFPIGILGELILG